MECETLNHPINNNITCCNGLDDIGKRRRIKIDFIRQMFKEDYENNKDLYELQDYEKVINNDFWITRYMANMDESSDTILERVKSTMRWRKSFGVNHFDPLTIPREVYQVSAIINYLPDRRGRPTFYIRGKIHRKIHQLEEKIKHYLVDRINYIDGINQNHESWLLILDASDASFLNTDMDMIMFLFHTLRNRFPQGVCQAFIYGLPWILGAFANMVLAILPSDSVSKIKFGGKKELLELIAEENLPDFLGGLGKDNYYRVPRKAQSVFDMAANELGMTCEDVEKLMKPFKPFIKPIEECELVDSVH